MGIDAAELDVAEIRKLYGSMVKAAASHRLDIDHHVRVLYCKRLQGGRSVEDSNHLQERDLVFAWYCEVGEFGVRRFGSNAKAAL